MKMLPGDDKITNTDEQEVAVNQSTKDEGGYDEPVNHSSSSSDEKAETKNEKEVGKEASPKHRTQK